MHFSINTSVFCILHIKDPAKTYNFTHFRSHSASSPDSKAQKENVKYSKLKIKPGDNLSHLKIFILFF